MDKILRQNWLWKRTSSSLTSLSLSLTNIFVHNLSVVFLIFHSDRLLWHEFLTQYIFPLLYFVHFLKDWDFSKLKTNCQWEWQTVSVFSDQRKSLNSKSDWQKTIIITFFSIYILIFHILWTMGWILIQSKFLFKKSISSFFPSSFLDLFRL